MSNRLEGHPRFCNCSDCLGLTPRVRLKRPTKRYRHIATLLSPDPEDERQGYWLSSVDIRKLEDLPPGTKLYVEDHPNGQG